jgi:hypothetical protein
VNAATRQPVEWWVAVPALVLLVFVVLVAPIWRWSRGWGWAPAGMFAVALGVVALFTGAWILS